MAGLSLNMDLRRVAPSILRRDECDLFFSSARLPLLIRLSLLGNTIDKERNDPRVLVRKRRGDTNWTMIACTLVVFKSKETGERVVLFCKKVTTTIFTLPLTAPETIEHSSSRSTLEFWLSPLR